MTQHVLHMTHHTIHMTDVTSNIMGHLSAFSATGATGQGGFTRSVSISACGNVALTAGGTSEVSALNPLQTCQFYSLLHALE